MARPLTLLLLILFSVLAPSLHAKAPISRTYDRFLKNCDDGDGLGCYNYGRGLWNLGRKKEALHYFARGCDLKYKLACDSYKDHSTIVHAHKHKSTGDGSGSGDSICYSKKEMGTAQFSSTPSLTEGVKGQKISAMKAASFWVKAGLRNGDILVRLNNMSLATQQDLNHAFAISGKTFGFEVIRDGDTIALWYTCH